MNLTIGASALVISIFVILVVTNVCTVGYIKSTGHHLNLMIEAGMYVAPFIVLAVLTFGFNWYYTNTGVGVREFKIQKSNLSNGINRRIRIYDVEGEMIENYSGKIDIEYGINRIIFDDEDGMRHIIYHPTGTVLVDEVGE